MKEQDGEQSLVKNAADPQQIKEAKQKEKLKRDVAADDLRKVMRTPEGRRVMWRLLARCGTQRISYIGHPYETHTLFLEGERNVGLMLTADLVEACKEQYLLMLQENLQSG